GSTYSYTPLSVSMFPPPPTSTLFPYTTLFRSLHFRQEGSEPGPCGPPRKFIGDVRGVLAWASQTKPGSRPRQRATWHAASHRYRSEEHTSELQSLAYLVCRLLLEKKKLISLLT